MNTKLKLNLDQLAVDSFDTTRAEPKAGTVFGEQCTCYTNCTCPGCPTCYDSCNGTCQATCNATCANTCAYTCDCGGGGATDGPACQSCMNTACGMYECCA